MILLVSLVCKFQNKIPNFTNFVNFLKNNRETEYHIIGKFRGTIFFFFFFFDHLHYHGVRESSCSYQNTNFTE